MPAARVADTSHVMDGETDHEATRSPRTRPLPLRVGDGEVILLADDVNQLVESADKLVAATYESLKRSGAEHDVSQKAIDELESISEVLTTEGLRFGDPPVEVDRDRARVLRQLLADIDGYQRRELTPGLLDLRRQLTAAA
jgi:hypothetical protein